MVIPLLWLISEQACGAHFDAVYGNPAPVVDLSASWEGTSQYVIYCNPVPVADLTARWEGTF